MEPFLFKIFEAGFPVPDSRSSSAPSLLSPDARIAGSRIGPSPKGTPGSESVLGPLRQQIQEVIATRVSSAIREDLLKLLRRPGYALHAEGACRAGRLALDVHEAVAGEPLPRAALLAAAAVELQMEASYVFDEVADMAPDGKRSEDLALATALHTAG